MKASKLFAVLIISFFVGQVFANPLPDPFEEPPSGGTVALDGEETPIALKEELVVIDLTENSAHVKGQYKLVNTSEKDTTAKVAFPDNSFLGPSVKSRLENFKVTVDGKMQKTKFMENENWEFYFLVSGLHRWEMAFSPSQKRNVIIEYDCSTQWFDIESGESAKGSNQFEYLLKTGSAWSGKIEKAEIRVNLKDDASHQIVGLKPKYASWKGNTIIWEIRDFEPDGDYNIRINYGPDAYKRFNSNPGIENLLEVMKNSSGLDKETKESLVHVLTRSIGTKEILDSLPEDDKAKKWIKKLEGIQ